MKENIMEMEKYASENNVPIIEKDSIAFIMKYIKKNNIKSVLEIGSAIGYSTILMASSNQDTIVTTIERDETRYMECLKNVKKCGMEKKINVVYQDALELNLSEDLRYDLIFIDAAKGKYPIFLKEAIRLSHKNTIILADNILYKGYVMSDYNKHKQRTAVTHLREYIKEATENEKLETEILEVGDGLAISKVKEAIQ